MHALIMHDIIKIATDTIKLSGRHVSKYDLELWTGNVVFIRQLGT